MTNAELAKSIEKSVGVESRDKDVAEVCAELLPGWSDLNQDSLQHTVISGGITNALLKVAPPEGSGLAPVVVRIFGDNTELLIDREREAQILVQLNNAGFGAKVLGRFSNGRIEEFLDCKTLDPEDLSHPVLTDRIAKKLHEFHLAPVNEPKSDKMCATLRSMIAQARGLKFEDAKTREEFEKFDFDQLDKEVDTMEELCKTFKSPIVYSHTDLLAGNILLMKDPETGKWDEASSPMTFIDFEYGMYSYRGFDFGNHFNEYAGFDCDWSLYPNTEHQKKFLKSYMECEKNGDGVSDQELDQLVAESNFFSLLSHLNWGIWGILQAKYSSIDFDYLDYSQNRINEYFARKDGYVEAAKKLLVN